MMVMQKREREGQDKQPFVALIIPFARPIKDVRKSKMRYGGYLYLL